MAKKQKNTITTPASNPNSLLSGTNFNSKEAKQAAEDKMSKVKTFTGTNTTTTDTTAAKTNTALPASAATNNAKLVEAQMDADYASGLTTGTGAKSFAQTLKDNEIASNMSDFNNGSYGNAFVRNPNLDGYGSMNGVYYEFYKDGTKKYIDEATGEDVTNRYVKGSSSTGVSSKTPSVSAAESYLADASKSASKTSITDDVLSTIYEYKDRPAFEYDPTKDTLYQNAINNAMKGGQMAMQDTMGQAAALTGGYGSSYATSAANQAYNQMIENAYDNMADYYNMALNAYQVEGDRLLNAYNMLSDQQKLEWEQNKEYYDRAWQEKRAARADFESDRAFDYGVSQDALDNDYRERQFEYGKGQDALDNDFRERQFEYGKDQDALDNDFRERQFEYGQSQDALDNDFRERQFEYTKGQDAISNDLAQQRLLKSDSPKSPYRYTPDSKDTGDDTAEERTDTPSRTEIQMGDVTKQVIKKLNNGDVEGAKAFLDTEDKARPFSDSEAEELYSLLDSVKDYYDPSQANWTVVGSHLVDDYGHKFTFDELRQYYINYLNSHGGATGGKVNIFLTKIQNLIDAYGKKNGYTE